MISGYSIKRILSNLFYRNVLYPLGYGRPYGRKDWESGYAEGYWDHLENVDEVERYKAVVRLVQLCGLSPKVFDVGCGTGILYGHMKQNIADFDYYGIDISENAVTDAGIKFPGVVFKQMDFDKEELDRKFDLVIFNETLNYFTRPLDKLKQCTKKNLSKDGKFIISLYKGHNGIWNTLTPHFNIYEDVVIRNQKGQRWNIKLIQPK